MNEKIEYVDDARGRSGFRVTIDDPGEFRETSFTASVDAVTGWTEGGIAVAEHEPYLHCMIKWDSCSHFHFGEPKPPTGKPGEDGYRDGYLHFCGVDDFKNHALLLEALYRIAFREMGREPREGEEW